MYPTTAELIDATTVDELLQLTVEQQDALRASAIGAVEDYTGQRFEPTVETRNITGTRKRKLYLPVRLESLTSASIAGALLTGVVVADDGDFIELPSAAGTGYYEQALRDVAGEPAPRGFSGVVAITGTWGWTDCPERVVTAIRYDMEDQALADTHALASTFASYRKLGVRDISQGNLRVTLGDEAVLSPRVVRQLARYVWTQAGELV